MSKGQETMNLAGDWELGKFRPQVGAGFASLSHVTLIGLARSPPLCCAVFFASGQPTSTSTAHPDHDYLEGLQNSVCLAHCEYSIQRAVITYKQCIDSFAM